MLARFRFATLCFAVVIASYLTAWIIACVFVNGDLGHGIVYLKYFWTGNAGERPAFTGMFSIVLTIPFASAAIWLLRRSRKKKRGDKV